MPAGSTQTELHGVALSIHGAVQIDRGHLTKRKKSYVKEIWGRQEGVGLEYTLA